MRHSTIILCCWLLTTAATAQEPYYYRGRSVGSEALYNPFSLILNGGYDIVQLDVQKRSMFRLGYANGFSNVFRNLSNPFTPVRRFGVGRFIRKEILPFTFNVEGAQWWPNYHLHLIGGGMTYVAMREWYSYHGFDAPGVWSLGTMMTYHLVNEAVENGAIRGDNIDPVADVYFFDIPGILLFGIDGVNEFFAHTLNLADWSLQPSLALRDWSLHNNGQYFSMKWKLPMSDSWHLFYYFGLRGLTGVSYRLDDGSAISVGAGLRANRLKTVEAATNTKTVDLVWNVGIFYDVDNALLASVFFSEYTDNMVTLNVYPGIIRFDSFSPGLWCVLGRERRVFVGLTTVWTPGIAVSSR